MALTECIPDCGEECRNRRIQLQQGKQGAIALFMAGKKGIGVRAVQPIKQGEYIIEYCGQIVPPHVYTQRQDTIYAHERHHYCLQLDPGVLIDAQRMGNESK